MTNEMKLLRAFIEAQGFEIEEIKTQKPFSDGLVTGSYELIDYKVTKKEFIVPLPVNSKAWGW